MVSGFDDILSVSTVNPQDTVTNKLILPVQVQPQDTVTSGRLIINQQKTFVPLPSIDSSRTIVVKKKKFIDPITLPEYQKYKDQVFDFSPKGVLFSEKTISYQDIIKDKLSGKKLSKVSVEKPKQVTTSHDYKRDITTHNIIQKTNTELNNNSSGNDWLIGVLIFVSILFGWIRVFYYKFVKRLSQAIINNSWSKKIFEEKSAVSQRISLVLNILFIVNISIFTILFAKFFNYSIVGYNDFQAFFVVLFVFFGLYLGKYLSYHIIGFIVKGHQYFAEYIHNIFLYNKIYGLFLFPIIWFIPFVDSIYAEILLFGGVGLFGVFYVLRVFRGLVNCMKINLSIFYMILYLCALEIFPMLIIYRTITLLM